MKKIVFSLIAVASIFSFTTNADAKAFTYSSYNKLGITNSFVVGDYIFNLDQGYSPNLQDIMIASRTIPEGKPTTLYSFLNIPALNFFMQQEIYSKATTTNTSEFKVFDAKFIYKNHIPTAKDSDIEEL